MRPRFFDPNLSLLYKLLCVTGFREFKLRNDSEVRHDVMPQRDQTVKDCAYVPEFTFLDQRTSTYSYGQAPECCVASGWKSRDVLTHVAHVPYRSEGSCARTAQSALGPTPYLFQQTVLLANPSDHSTCVQTTMHVVVRRVQAKDDE